MFPLSRVDTMGRSNNRKAQIMYACFVSYATNFGHKASDNVLLFQKGFHPAGKVKERAQKMRVYFCPSSCPHHPVCPLFFIPMMQETLGMSLATVMLLCKGSTPAEGKK